jgi:quercetin 2,3-dioxygenase
MAYRDEFLSKNEKQQFIEKTMSTGKRVTRSVEDKWNVVLKQSSDIHSSGWILPADNAAAFDPFLIMAEDVTKKGAFDYHPHRGMETMTYIIDGELNHLDNKGGKGVLKKGDVQWMTAGKGLLHLEEPPADGFAHTLQLWINLPAKDKLVAPRHQDISHKNAPVLKQAGAIVTVFSGNSGIVKSPTQNYAKVTMVEVVLEKGASFSQDFPADYNGFIYILEGSGVFGDDKTEGKANDVLWLTPSVDNASEIFMQANEALKLLIIAGKPLREPVSARGPFVMNTEAELIVAFREFRKGDFGSWNH